MKEKKNTKPEEEKAGALPPETGEKAAGAGQQDMSHETERSEACEKRLSWEEILADPEYRQAFDTQVQTIVQRRLRNRQSAEASLERLAPVFAALGERYGLENSEPDAIDALALAAQILGQDGEEDDGAEIYRHFEQLVGQEASLKERVPEFSLSREMENPAFLKLTAPHTGLSLADAYYALHRDEIGREAALRSLEALTRSLRAGGGRPREISGNQPASTYSADPRSMSREERAALKRRIYEAKAQGKKLPYGG